MKSVDFEEWQLTPDARHPAWQSIEEFARRSLKGEGVERILVFERASSDCYEIARSYDSPRSWTEEIGAMIRDALRRDALLGFALRDSRELGFLLGGFRQSKRGTLWWQDAMRELGANVLGLESVLATAQKLILVGHDGEPVFILSVNAHVSSSEA